MVRRERHHDFPPRLGISTQATAVTHVVGLSVAGGLAAVPSYRVGPQRRFRIRVECSQARLLCIGYMLVKAASGQRACDRSPSWGCGGVSCSPCFSSPAWVLECC
jgi:hypothetical protein